MNTTWIGMDTTGNQIYLDIQNAYGSFEGRDAIEVYRTHDDEIVAVVKYLGDEHDCIDVLYASRYWEINNAKGDWVVMHPFTPGVPEHLF